MKTKLKLSLGIFILGILFAIVSTFIKNFNPSYRILSPFGESLDILSFFKKEVRPRYIVYGYMPYWNLDSVDSLQMDKLTHIAYFGININPDGTFMKTTTDDNGNIIPEPGYDKWENDPAVLKMIAKAKQSDVRIALTVISHVDTTSDKFLDCRACWKTLLDNLKTELDAKGITDVNLNFEYADYTDEVKAKEFADFTKYLNEELDKTYFDSYVVVSAFADSAVKPRISSDLNDLGKSADGIFIMAYDFHRPDSINAGPVAPIDKTNTNSDYDLITMIKDFESKIAPGKLILGVPYYGYDWVVQNADKNAVRLDGNDSIGHSVSQSYITILQIIEQYKPNLMWEPNAQEEYFTYTDSETGSIREVYFENEQALRARYDLLKQASFGGVGIWALGFDGDRPELWNLLSDEFVK